jgi:uncharacterized lipoprotein YmbA
MEKSDYQVTADVTRFDGRLGDKALLRTRWSVFDSQKNELLYRTSSNFSEPTGSADVAALVAAKSRTVADLSREMAAAIKALSEGKTPGQ